MNMIVAIQDPTGIELEKEVLADGYLSWKNLSPYLNSNDPRVEICNRFFNNAIPQDDRNCLDTKLAAAESKPTQLAAFQSFLRDGPVILAFDTSEAHGFVFNARDLFMEKAPFPMLKKMMNERIRRVRDILHHNRQS
jgi:hypothetical protein